VGGGTTEVAVFSLGDAVAAQSIRTGGDAMDRAVVDYLHRHYSLRIGMPAAEQLRIDVGSAYPLERESSREIRGLDAASGLPRAATITSEEVRQALATLDGCSPELAADLVDQGLVLCGGGSLLRGLERYLAEQTGLPARVADEPRAAVARGTLICLEHLDRWRAALESSDDDV
jgi:rod shape-determining protein MreB